MTALAVALAFFVGVALGLLGGGGSILAVPLLVYVAGLDTHEAVTVSLLVVGVTSLVGMVSHGRAGRVRWATGALFAAGGVPAAYLGGRLGSSVPEIVLLLAFATMMIATATAMLRGRSASRPTGHRHPAALVGLGAAVGAVTGFVGAGGGFLILPALVLVGGLAMPEAVGTSLLVIAVQSAAGLAGHLGGTPVPWPLALSVTAVAVAGSLVGARLVTKVDPARLRTAFGWFVLTVGSLVVGQQAAKALQLGGAAVAVVILAAPALIVPLAALFTRRRGHPPTASSALVPQTPRSSRMYFAQYYLDCLSHASYLIGDTTTGQAVVVDPRRDVQEYLDDAAAHGQTIVGVINTHFHADFLAGHLELADATGAWIGYGREATAEYAIRSLRHGERISLGEVALEILETPGHTPESISVLVYEHASDTVPYGVLTGDTLFIGDVGRPDLLASIGVTADELGEKLYHSVQTVLMGLPDDVRVFPAHGAGSACGKNLSTERQSTIGAQRVLNYACQPMSQEEFVAIVTAGQPVAPAYFLHDAILNRKERPLLDLTLPALDLVAVDEIVSRRGVVLDTRDQQEFAAGHLAGSLNIPADGRFAETAGMVLAADTPVVVVAPEGREQEVATRMARIGFDAVAGYLEKIETVLAAHPGRVATASRLTAPALVSMLGGAEPPFVLDVRNPGERDGGYIEGSLNIPLAELTRRIDEVPSAVPVVVHCAGGWRSSVAASVLRRAGRDDVSDLLGGYNGWAALHEPALNA